LNAAAGSHSRRRERLLCGALLLCSSAASAAAAELVLRRYERHLAARRREPVNMPLFRSNPHGTGSFRLRPKLRLSQKFWGIDVDLTTNSHGMRWREVPVQKPAGKLRLAFVGDSFTFGCWASTLERSFVGVVDRALAASRFEVLNFGVPGYGVDDAELLVREEVMRFDPDYVIAMVYNGNDLRDTYLGLHKQIIRDGTAGLDDAALRRMVPPQFLRRGTLRQPEPPRRTWLARRLERFAAYRLAAPLLGLKSLALEFVPGERFTSYTFWSRHPYPEVARRARDATLDTLGRMHEFLDARRVRLAVASIPTREQVYSRRAAGEDFDIAFPQEFIRLFARERGIPFLDLLPPLRREGLHENVELFAHRDPHLGDRGHAVVGRELSDWFRCCVRASALARSTVSDLGRR
jgi:lysophospholipase L1-like esterase